MVQALLEDGAEVVPDLGIVVGALAGDVGELLEHLAGELAADRVEGVVLLQHLARDVEREVLGVDDAADEAEVGWEQLVAVVDDEDAAGEQLQRLAVLHEQVGRRLAGDVQERDDWIGASALMWRWRGARRRQDEAAHDVLLELPCNPPL
ncbi:MAG: hypothetical protein IPJ59_36020 [Nannocystis sp.]|nr:hypothetical protein [Nannocystis sp.]MBK7830549.1 hypothetical protein [Nannocystis sp.]